jgi:hypothetical protein
MQYLAIVLVSGTTFVCEHKKGKKKETYAIVTWVGGTTHDT